MRYVLSILKIIKSNAVTAEVHDDKQNITFAISEIVPLLYSGLQVFHSN